MVHGAGEHTTTQDTLFGAQAQTHSLVLEKAEVSAHVRSRIAADKKLFGGLSTQGKAETLATEGNTIDPGKNKARAMAAEQAAEVYDWLSTRAGVVDDLLNDAAKELASGKGDGTDIKARAYEAIRGSLREALGRGVGPGRGIAQADPSGPGEGTEEAQRPGRAELEAAGQRPLLSRRAPKPIESHVLPGMDGDQGVTISEAARESNLSRHQDLLRREGIDISQIFRVRRLQMQERTLIRPASQPRIVTRTPSPVVQAINLVGKLYSPKEMDKMVKGELQPDDRVEKLTPAAIVSGTSSPAASSLDRPRCIPGSSTGAPSCRGRPPDVPSSASLPVCPLPSAFAPFRYSMAGRRSNATPCFSRLASYAARIDPRRPP